MSSGFPGRTPRGYAEFDGFTVKQGFPYRTATDFVFPADKIDIVTCIEEALAAAGLGDCGSVE